MIIVIFRCKAFASITNQTSGCFLLTVPVLVYLSSQVLLFPLYGKYFTLRCIILESFYLIHLKCWTLFDFNYIRLTQ